MNYFSNSSKEYTMKFVGIPQRTIRRSHLLELFSIFLWYCFMHSVSNLIGYHAYNNALGLIFHKNQTKKRRSAGSLNRQLYYSSSIQYTCTLYHGRAYSDEKWYVKVFLLPSEAWHYLCTTPQNSENPWKLNLV